MNIVRLISNTFILGLRAFCARHHTGLSRSFGNLLSCIVLGFLLNTMVLCWISTFVALQLLVRSSRTFSSSLMLFRAVSLPICSIIFAVNDQFNVTCIRYIANRDY